jgi:hypothetical protein
MILSNFRGFDASALAEKAAAQAFDLSNGSRR